MIKVLLAEDEPNLGMIVKESLENRNFQVTHCLDGVEAQKTFLQNKFDVLVLDIMMPKKDGFTLAKEIRQTDKIIPILFLTSKSQTQDVVDGFKIGGNDYLKKPFSMEELIVRIESLVHRVEIIDEKVAFEIGEFELNPDTQMLSHPSKSVMLTHRESALLQLLIQNKGIIIERSFILETIWGADDFFNGRSMDVFITKLRKKLSLDSQIQIINIRGRGYKLID
uniref:response regulator transcription factor n=1 Tax=Flavobacterium sp. TaxID=239 RepID=UPI00404ACD19